MSRNLSHPILWRPVDANSGKQRLWLTNWKHRCTGNSIRGHKRTEDRSFRFHWTFQQRYVLGASSFINFKYIFCWLFDSLPIFFFLTKKSFWMALPIAYGNSWARGWIRATAVTYAAAVAAQDPLTRCARLGIKPATLQQPKPLQSDSSSTVPQGGFFSFLF